MSGDPPDHKSVSSDQKCSFCNRYKRKVRYMVSAGENKSSICDECVRKVDEMMRTAAVEERVAKSTGELQTEIARLKEELAKRSEKYDFADGRVVSELKWEVERLRKDASDQCEAFEAVSGHVRGLSAENSGLRTRLFKIEKVLSIAKAGSREQLLAAIDDFEQWQALREKRLKEGIDSILVPE